MNRIIMHIDVNNAFLSWTAVDLLNNGFKYDIRNSYAVIGGDEKSRNGIVLAKSNPAKKMGVISAETLYSARKKCPSLKSYPPNYSLYSKMSKELFKLLSNYTNDIEIASIDECYLDYTPIKKLCGNEIEFANRIKLEVYQKLGFTINVGIANNKLCAKMASDLIKPDKVNTIFDDEIETKMYPLPVGDLFGIGKQTALKLNQIDIMTIGDLANYDTNKLIKYFKNRANDMINLAKGKDNSLVNNEEWIPKGISNETTFDHDISNKEELKKYLFALADYVGVRLRKQKKYANVVGLILKDNQFNRKNKQIKLPNPTNITEEIYLAVSKLLDETYNLEPIRLIGIRLDNLTSDEIYQTSLFENYAERKDNSKLNEIMDSIKEKYGTNAIKKASLLENKLKKH